jgi:hypothetical protein
MHPSSAPKHPNRPVSLAPSTIPVKKSGEKPPEPMSLKAAVTERIR